MKDRSGGHYGKRVVRTLNMGSGGGVKLPAKQMGGDQGKADDGGKETNMS